MLGKLNRYVARLSIFLITVALIAGMAGCLPGYDLTISSTAGGSVTTPGEGTFSYYKETVVDLVAEADEGYRFVSWIGDVGTIDNIEAATTTITIYDDYSIFANFTAILEIQDWYDLDAIRNKVGVSYIMMNNLDSATAGYQDLASSTANEGKGWKSIGTEDDSFTGIFDGQGYEILDLFINRSDEGCVGLFSAIDGGGVIKDIGVVNATVNGGACVGGLVGWNGGTVSRCYSSGNVKGGGNVGGLAGKTWYGTVSNSHSTGNVSGNLSVGGLVGWNVEGTVSNSYATGNVTGNDSVGGLVGWNHYGTVSNSYATGSVTGNRSVGGLVGFDFIGSVTNSYSTGSVTGHSWVGGLVGRNDYSTLSNSYYNYDEALINGESTITSGALFSEDFEQWLANDKSLDVNERLSQENSYYLVNNVNDFKQLLAFGQDSSLKFRLTTDLDLATEPGLYIPYLAGEFDGSGHKVSNLSFNYDFISDVGLFGYLARGGNVTQVRVENVRITGASRVGGLVGQNSGDMSNSYSTGGVSGGRNLGGLVGENRGTVSSSYSTGNVTGDDDVGGLVGENVEGIVSNSYSSANVTGEDIVGGLVGMDAGIVSNCYSTGSVTGNDSVGGLVGVDLWGILFGSSTVSNSFWDRVTSGMAESDGGTGKTTTEMKDIDTFTDTEKEGLNEPWDMTAVAPGETNDAYIWNIVDGETYPFLSWEP